MTQVRVEGLVRRFGAVTALDGVSLQVHAGELFTLLGPSGCGKTTLLRILAGLETTDGGAVWFGGERVESVPAHRRNIGMVFQNYAVFPHMTVFDNVAYGLRSRQLPASQVSARAREALALVRMEEYGERRPDQLSGGQQQRVALARALATRPALLLMDEPLANLDAQLRQAMREEIRRLQRQVGITTVYVTHDQEEALAISDRIGVMEAGKLLQAGPPAEIYRRPASTAVAAFVGTCSFLRNGDRLYGVRPEAATLVPAGTALSGDLAAYAGTVEEETYLGHGLRVRVRLTATGEPVAAAAPGAPGTWPVGAAVVVAVRPEDLLAFRPETGEALP